MDKQYRLPDGGVTTNVEAYLAAWEEFASVTLEFFPGYTAHGYDPNVVLTNNQPYAPLLNLTVSAVKALRDYRDRKQAEIAALQEEVSLLRAEVRKQAFGSKVVFDREVVERAQTEAAQGDGTYPVTCSVCSRSYRSTFKHENWCGCLEPIGEKQS